LLTEIFAAALDPNVAELLDHFEVASVARDKQAADSLDRSCNQHVTDDALLFLVMKPGSLPSSLGFQAAQKRIEDLPRLNPIVGGRDKQFSFPFILLLCGLLLFTSVGSTAPANSSCRTTTDMCTLRGKVCG